VSTKPQRDGVSLGLALSGGGHRAALFAAGALLGVVDAEQQAHTVSIASVSGGSLTNGLVAAGTEFTTCDRAGLEQLLKPGLRSFSHDGLFFAGPQTNSYVRGVFFLFGLLVATLLSGLTTLTGLGWPWEAGPALRVAAVVAVLLAVLVVWKLPVPRTFRLPFAVGLASLAGLAPLGVLLTRGLDGGGLGLAVVGVLLAVGSIGVVTVRVFGWRSDRVDDALAQGPIGAAALASVDRSVHHLYCPTDLQSADHAYLSPRIVYGYEMGCSTPALTLRLSTAVQASACFPGGFVPRRLPAAAVAAGPLLQEHVVLTDGGVYDNMADQWEFGWDNRVEEFAKRGLDLTAYQPVPASRLVVVNAGGSFKPGPVKGTGLRFELASLLRGKDVQYDVSTSLRRRYLVDIFERAALPTDLHGALVHIGQVPATVPSRYASPDLPDLHGRRQRALQALAFLDRLSRLDPQDWKAIRDRNVRVKTVLSALGVTTSTDLLHQSYLLTRLNLFVLLNAGSLPAAAESDAAVLSSWGRDRFARLVKDSAGA
jgi:hypothetical protein